MLIKSVVFVVALLCSFGSYAKQSEAELVDSLDRYLASIQFHVYEQKIGVSKNGVTEVVFNIKFSSSVSPNDLITPLFESYMSGGMYITKPQKQRVESFNYKQRQALARKGKPMPLHQPSAVELAIPVSLLDFEEPVKASFGVFTDTCLNQNIDLALMNPLMILVKIIKLRWIHILSYDQMVSRKINNQTTRCANSIFYTTLFTNSAPNYT